MSQISLKYTRNENDLTVTIDRVVEKMDNNPDFADAPDALKRIKELQPLYRLARANAQSRDKEMVAVKNVTKVQALKEMQQLHEYVFAKSKGDATIILSSGFDVTPETRNRNTQPPSIETLIVELGEAGEATMRVKNVTGIKAYIHQYTTETPTANTVWASEGSSDGAYTFQGLVSGQRYWFRVVAIGYNKQRSYSQVISKVIQ